MLETLLRWWATQMLGWLPAGTRTREDGLIAAMVPAGLVLSGRGGAGLGTFGLDAAGQDGLRRVAAPFRGRPVLLQVPQGALLERDVPLPLAAERNLDGVLGFEMDRLTPFAAADVHWGWTVVRRDREAGRLVLRLRLVPKAAAAAALAALAAAGLVPGAIEAPGPAGAPGGRRIALRGTGPAGGRWGRQGVAVLGGLCAVLALAAVALPFVLQSVRGAAVEAQIAALRPRVDRVEALRRRLLAGGADRDAMVAERARVGDALGVLAALTAVMPDDTFLTDFSLRSGQVTVSGQSGAAARLIGAMAADPVFRNPAFTAPVTRAEGADRRDVFSLRADSGPGEPVRPPGRRPADPRPGG